MAARTRSCPSNAVRPDIAVSMRMSSNPAGFVASTLDAMKLSTRAYQRARSYLMESARPFDRALFQFEFEGGSAEPVREALGR